MVFVSDHGELNGAHGLYGKQYPYEESIGIPLIIEDPTIPGSAGAEIADPVHTEDLYPTLLGLAGISPSVPSAGEDLSRIVRGEISGLERTGVYLEFVAEHRTGVAFHDEVWRGFRSQRFVYTVKGDKHGAAPWQFFDLDSDPGQLANLLGDPDYLDEIVRHHSELRAIIETGDDLFALEPAFGCDGINQPYVSPD